MSRVLVRQVGDAFRGGAFMKEAHEEEQNRYTFGFLLFIFVLAASVLAATLKVLFVLLG